MQAQHSALSRNHLWILGAGGLCLLLGALPPGNAAAGEPVAVIEQVAAPSTGLQFMDFVEVGRLIKLRSGESLTLGYFGSCIQETITGGSVQIGTDKSDVEGGEVARQQVECDGGRLQLDMSSNDSSGVLILRSVNPEEPAADSAGGALPAPQLVLFHTQPIVGVSTPNSLLRIERLDADEPRLEVRIESRYLDFAAAGKSLVAGGLYRAEAVGHSVVFRIDPGAAAGGGSVIGRLIYL